MILISKKIFPAFLLCLLLQLNSKGQQSNTSEFVLSGSCQWDKTATKSKKELRNKTGSIYQRFGTTIINIKGKAYNPCNLPSNLIGKRVLISGILYKNAETDGIPIKLTYLKVLNN